MSDMIPAEGVQREFLENAEQCLRVGPVGMALLLDTPWNTYKAWKSERNRLPGVAKVAIGLLVGARIFKQSSTGDSK